MVSRALLILTLFAWQPAVAQTVWTMETEYPASSMPGQGVSNFSRLVTEKTGGRVSVEPTYDASKGIKSAGMLEAVKAGHLQAGDTFVGALSSVDPVFALSSLPFLVTSVEDAKRLADLARPDYEAVFHRNGQRLLYLTPWPPSGIWSKGAIQNPSALKALHIRTYDAGSEAVMRAAGATSASISFADLMPKLRDGTFNAVLSSGDGGAGRKLWDFLPNFTEIDYALPLSAATVNSASYEALSEDLRHDVDQAAAETEALQWSAIGSRLQQNYDRMRANHVAINTAPSAAVMADLKRGAKPAIDNWTRSARPEQRSILERFQSK